MPLLKLLKGQAPQHEYVIGTKKLVLGRDGKANVRLGQEEVSRNHAEILRDDDDYFIIDLSSRNHTYVNGTRLDPGSRCKLQHNDLIKICGFIFTFLDTVSDRWRTSGSSDSRVAKVLNSDQTVAIDRLDSSSGNWDLRTSINPEAKLRAMIQISRDLHKALALDQVLDKVLDSLLKIFQQADCAVAVLHDEKGEPEVRAVQQRDETDDEPVFLSRSVLKRVMDEQQAVLSDDLKVDPRFSGSQSVAKASRRAIMCAPLLDLEGKPLGALQLDASHKQDRFTEDDLDLFSSVALQVSLAIDDSILHETVVREREMQRDLEVAREIQFGLLPSEAPHIEGYDFYDFYAPAKYVGGDFYDYLKLPDGRLGIVLGDVAGKGVSAALLMAKLTSEIRVHLAAGLSPLEICTTVNTSFCSRGSYWRFVTAVLMILDPVNHEITFVNAGHMKPLVRKQDGSVVEIGGESSGLPLGVDATHRYQQVTEKLAEGELMVIYSDGVSDAMNADGKRFEVEGVQALLAKVAAPAAEFGKQTLDQLDAFVGGHTQTDDICFLVVGRKES